MQATILDQTENIYSVSRLNNEVKTILEENFPFVWVEGEISNFAAPHSGHWYFSLKDATAQVRCAMFRGSQRKLLFVPKDGMHVLLKARVSLYENRGEFQLIAEDMEERGEGRLRRAFEILKKKLEAAGLFTNQHKKPIPLFPRQIGVITSATGAAIRDILTAFKRRYACVPIIIYPTLVQGEGAAATIVNAIQTANRRNECDLLILARGGGSLEDLWPFNEEVVAHAIHHSQLPIISGVGHEIDFTIADFVADIRAATPTAAAEIASPQKNEIIKRLFAHHESITLNIKNKFRSQIQQLMWMQKHLTQQHPKKRLIEKMQTLDHCELKLLQLQKQLFNKNQITIKNLNFRLHQHLPLHRIQQISQQMNNYQQSMGHIERHLLNKFRQCLASLAAKLDTLSPLATLKRGYAIVTNADHSVIHNVKNLQVEDKINVRLAQSTLKCVVKKID